MELSQHAKNTLLERFPKVELSYEIITHKKVASNYNIGIAIPNGKKCFVWFTFNKEKEVCYLLELNKEKKVVAITEVHTYFHHSCSKGTILYGTLIQEQDGDSGKPLPYSYFVLDDIFYYKGIPLKTAVGHEKLKYMEEFCKKSIVQKFGKLGECPKEKAQITIVLSGMWFSGDDERDIPEEFIESLAYSVHHIQYRTLNETAPYLNLSLNKKNVGQPITHSIPRHILMKGVANTNMNIGKPQYKYPAVFMVSADIQYDVYYLYAFCVGGGGSGGDELHSCVQKDNLIYYNVAYIPDYKTSVFMNGIFRRIKANANLDAIEESDDEAEFSDYRPDKYVDLEKKVKMECVFNSKFRKWVPRKIVGDREKIVHISKL